MTRNWLLGLSIGLVFASACATESDLDGEICEAGKCDGTFLEQLNGRQDPIAKWLRTLGEAGAIDAQGVYRASKAGSVAPASEPLFYGKLLTGLATVQGCDPNALINYA
ncbi:MAG: hypothetical protein H0V17_33410, partial [Deltaproteobacteria bacterium]|nr:hypothetical protein [Deltaproteobacteria bacterium]